MRVRIDDESGNEDYGGVADFFQEIVACDEDVSKSGDGEQRGNWIEPHAEGTRHVRLADAEHDESDGLHDELQKDANDDQGRDYVGQWEKAKQDSGSGEREQ